jgi:drug/metabolite transporter (DMT)-like permease|tara:strand:- start:26 stop:970 length:945 start_codon:yes stop_codon:yes gene_type:complete
MLEKNRTGVFLIIIGMTIFSIHDSFIKVLSTDISLIQIQFVRSSIAVLTILIYLKLTKQPFVFRTGYPFLTLVRGLLSFFGYSAFYLAQSKMPIANISVLFLTSPFFITIISIYFFDSRVGWRRWLAMVIGFCGVIFICSPEGGQLNLYYVIPVLVAVAYALSVILAKKTADKDTLYQTIVFQHLIAGSIAAVLGLTFGDGRFDNEKYSEIEFVVRAWSLGDPSIMLSLIGLSVVGVGGFGFLLQAYRIADPAVVSPYEYTFLIWMVLWGYLIWGDIPSVIEATGMLLIVGAGVYMFYREQIRNQELAVDTTLR